MKIFIDSAELKELEAAAATGLVDGVTTNPSLVSKSGLKFEDLLLRICELIDGPVSAEVTALGVTEMICEGKALARLNKNIVVKAPLTWDGLKATKALASEGIAVNVTLCFTPVQALMAAKAGARYISPFVGRLDDIGHKGMALIDEIKVVYDQYKFKTEILAASIRHVEHVLHAAKVGAHVATMPYKVFNQLLKHPLTEAGLAQFLKDWENAKK